MLSYKTYRLRKTDNSYNDEIAQSLSKTARKLKHVMTVPLFNGEDSIAVLAFLKNYKFACDETGFSEGAALPLMKYFMGGEAKDTMFSLNSVRSTKVVYVNTIICSISSHTLTPFGPIYFLGIPVRRAIV